ncbi:hypothetical protein [Chengkuizengella axinellae]|uniref:Uncharacterized protein n=1 Tax=Chengkuizengella axinellae TaxID=3064388 RepID=A0ABT9IV75_9BACL|nr:hypothetical protein [Chengkuizengella sp. 2205SS18-9]MDP5273246.1 hypothetical protein [Chengkuizengella sp. 2205SS18-9]
MQCILQQLVNLDEGDIGVVTQTFGIDDLIINQVKDFMASTNIGNIPVCQITLVSTFDPTIIVDINKRIKKSKGECACCEDPITNVAKSMIGNLVDIDFISPTDFGTFTDEIIDVGEGIIVGRNLGDPNEIDFFSSCSITRIAPANEQINDQPRFSNFRELKRSIPPLSTKGS